MARTERPVLDDRVPRSLIADEGEAVMARLPVQEGLVIPPTPGLHFPNAVIRGLPQIRLVMEKIQLPQLMPEQRADASNAALTFLAGPRMQAAQARNVFRFRSGR
jgi:hypothetical protein